mmetsp:Transcript_19569/g.46034  ORF Transcript_19569/g.46034 Transcript_19569/m.46034 type:complete len:257 (-) Transcript_19569:3358-4128(-)
MRACLSRRRAPRACRCRMRTRLVKLPLIRVAARTQNAHRPPLVAAACASISLRMRSTFASSASSSTRRTSCCPWLPPSWRAAGGGARASSPSAPRVGTARAPPGLPATAPEASITRLALSLSALITPASQRMLSSIWSRLRACACAALGAAQCSALGSSASACTASHGLPPCLRTSLGSPALVRKAMKTFSCPPITASGCTTTHKSPAWCVSGSANGRSSHDRKVCTRMKSPCERAIVDAAASTSRASAPTGLARR